MQHPPKPRWEIDPGSKCPCGSGLPYRRCCRPNAALIEKSQEFFDRNDYASAERATRAELTRYIGWVFQHTIPLLRLPNGPSIEIVRIDIDALEEAVERLAIALERQGKKEGILHTFEHLTATVKLPGLDQRMAFLACLWAERPLNQPQLARKILANWPSYANIQDGYLLQIYFDLRADELSPVERIGLIDRILERTQSSIERLHYATLKAMLTVVTGEEEQAIKMHDQTMGALFPTVADAATNGEFMAIWTCARALELRGLFPSRQNSLRAGPRLSG
jgi:hypothetical protein